MISLDRMENKECDETYRVKIRKFQKEIQVEEEEEEEETSNLNLCYDCKIEFGNETELYNHLLTHVKQPIVILKPLERTKPIKITLKNNRDNSFEIINSSDRCQPSDIRTSEEVVDGPDDCPETEINAAGETAESDDHVVDDEAVEDDEIQEPEEYDQNELLNNDDRTSPSSEDGACEEREETVVTETEHEDEEVEEQDQEQDEEVDQLDENEECYEEAEERDCDNEAIGGEQLDTEEEDEEEENAEGEYEEETHVENACNVNNDENEESTSQDSIAPEEEREVIEDGEEEDEEEEEVVATATVIHEEYEGTVPGGEPTPPPDASPERSAEFPKIRIKSGLLKERLLAPEASNDERKESSRRARDGRHESRLTSGNWTTPLEDPLKINDPLSIDRDDGKLISSLFSNNNDRAKDLGFTTSDNDFIAVDRLEERNRNGALQLYSPANRHQPPLSRGPLDSLANLPMQQLAQQVSRLQPNNGMHQQNVLINIQQFPQAPPSQPPPPHHTYLPPSYQYLPPTSIYPYPSPPSYAPYIPPPPLRPPLPQHAIRGMQPPPPSYNQAIQHQQQQQQQQQQQHHHQRNPLNLRPQILSTRLGSSGGSIINERQHLTGRQQPLAPRPLVPPPRIRPGTAIRGQRPRPSPQAIAALSKTQQQIAGQMQQRTAPKRAAPEQMLQAKRKRLDMLIPNKNDDSDCQLISVQPKNSGLPQIQNVQGNVQEQGDNSNGVMHLSDSITLSVRNPAPKPIQPKKSDAKAVANILATRGITVTAAPKAKEKPAKSATTPIEPPVAINLNSAVSIIPAKSGSKADKVQTFDLTDDNQTDDVIFPPALPPPKSPPVNKSPQAKPLQRGLPFRCDLCPAQYPNISGLRKHRQTFHKTGGPCDYGIPVIDMKQPGIMQKLSAMGINNYIPVSASNDFCLGLPIIKASAMRSTNLNAIGATKILSLGPIRSVPPRAARQ